MNVSVIIPISLEDANRRLQFEWIHKFYKKVLPEVELCIGEMNEKPFSKAKAINKGVKKSKGDILIIADAAIFYDPYLLNQSVKFLEKDAWVTPYEKVLNLTKQSTAELLKI